MSMQWTPSQQKAIDIRGADVLVSAAAGSGKTAALTERVFSLITDEENGCGIDRLLIVTFTNAAAAELKERIRKRLQKALSASPSRHLRKQLSALPRAKISTVHGFCYSVIKENASSLSLPVGIRIADDTERDLLYRQITDETVYDAYEKKPPFDTFDFEALCDHFLKSKTDEKLVDIFLGIYTEALNSPKRLKLLSESADMHRDVSKNGFAQSKYFDAVLNRTNYVLGHFISEYERIEAQYADSDIFTKYCEIIDADCSLMKACLSAVNNRHYAEAKKLFETAEFARLPSVRGESELKNDFKNVRDALKKEVKELGSCFGYTEDDIKRLALSSAEIADGLYKFLSVLDTRITEAKKERKILDFSDLEQYACMLLYDSENGKPTALAEQISAGFSEVMIDEYQDTNEIQDLIFSSVGKGKRFMVGDIKQSIYGFRGAVPQIFADYRKQFTSDTQTTVFFSENFRCSEPIIRFTNSVFSKLFAFNEAVPYTASDALVFGKKADDKCGEQSAEVILIEADGECNGEAVWVAEKISELLKNGTNEKGEKYVPSDFAILLRSVKENSEPYENELRMRGIPVYNIADGNFFDGPEIELMISLLSVIDNPINDIYLASVMKSPLFGFSLDELMALRAESRKTELYYSVRAAADNGCEKCSKLLESLSKYRYISRSMPVDKFISYIYSDMNIIQVLCACDDPKDAGIKKANLHLLYEYAKSFEYGSFKGLYNFVSYLHDIISKGKTLAEAKPADAGQNGVRILTVHKSKGLEFPVCFVCGCNKKSTNTKSGNPIFSRNYLFAFKPKDPSGFIINKTPMYLAAQSDNKTSEFYEATRVLYVALTRARQRLFVCAEIKDCQAFKEKNLSLNADEYTVNSATTYMEMILRSLPADSTGIKTVTDVYVSENVASATEQTLPKISSESLEDELRQRLSYVYPHKKISETPKKISVSKLYPDFLDEDEPIEIPSYGPTPFTLPDADFALCSTNNAAERGTATHAFMQFCNISSAKADTEAECERLIASGYMPSEFKELIYMKELEKFFESELCSRLLASTEVYREYRFNMALPASLFTSDPEISPDDKLYVQGIIDCFFMNPDGTVTVLDYKTDRLYASNTEQIEEFKQKHKTQLKYYAAAVEKITARPVSKKILYSFCLGRAFEV